MKILLVAPVLIKKQKNRSPWPGLFRDEDAVELSQHLAEYYKLLADKYQIEFLDASLYAEASDIDFVHMDAQNHKKITIANKEKIVQIMEL